MAGFIKESIFFVATVLLAAGPLSAQLSSAPTKPIIREITVNIREIFEGDDLQWFYRAANDLKISTREKIVRRELLFKEGQEFDEFTIQESERNLRSLKYINKVSITPYFEGNYVDILVSVRDTWTLIPALNFSSGSGKDTRSAGIGETDLLGYGKRVAVVYGEEDGRTQLSGLYEDNRFLGSRRRLGLGYFDRSDGYAAAGSFGKPFRSLLDHNGWLFDLGASDTVERLFEAGDESFIYRQDRQEFASAYGWAWGTPEEHTNRVFLGYGYSSNNFTQADLDDFEDVNVDPDSVSMDPALLAEDRRYSAISLEYHRIGSDFINMSYIDRFDLVQDFNLGNVFIIESAISPEALGSNEDTLFLGVSDSHGWRSGASSFIRGEVGASSRYADEFENTVLRSKTTYYQFLGTAYLGDIFMGRHTLASSLLFEYGDDLDRNVQLTLGADTGLRGYDADTLTGDKLVIFSVEERAHLIEDYLKLISIGAAAFIDVGGASDDSLGTLLQDEIYSDVGFGLRFNFPRSSGSRVLRFDLAWPLRDGPDGSQSGEMRFLVKGGMSFNSDLLADGTLFENTSVGTLATVAGF